MVFDDPTWNPGAYRGTPSFDPIYSSARVMGERECGTISHRPPHEHCAGAHEPWWEWADVLVDFRTRAGRVQDLPWVLPTHEQQTWAAGSSGWSMTGHLIAPEPLPPMSGDWRPREVDGTSVLRIVDDAGFRVAFVVSNDKPTASQTKHKFSVGRLATLLPGLREHLLAWKGNKHWSGESKAASRRSMRNARLEARFRLNATDALVDLPCLFAAVRDPHRWLGQAPGTALESVSYPGPYRAVPAVRALVEWAAAGAGSFTEVSHLVHAGLDAAEVTRWRAMESIEHPRARAVPEQYREALPWPDETIAEWYAVVGGGEKITKFAYNSRVAGLTAAEADRWRHLLHDRAFEQRLQVRAIIDAGWTPEDMEAVQTSIHAETLLEGSHYDGARAFYAPISFAEVAPWVSHGPQMANALIRAGLSPTAAQQIAETGQVPDMAALEVMAALRHGAA